MDPLLSLFNFSNLIGIIQDFFQSALFRNFIFGLKVFSGIVSLFFIAIIYYCLKNSTFLSTKLLDDVADFIRTGIPVSQKKIIRQWEAVLKKLETNNEASWKLAVVEADNMLDTILKSMGYKGETMGERLKQLEPIHLANIDDVWDAHRARNQIVHDPSYKLNHGEAREIIDVYRKSFENFELI